MISKIVLREEPLLEIGHTSPPFIIAEVGSNFTSLTQCLDSISQAKLAGASAVKFQIFREEDLYGFNKDSGIDIELEIDWLAKLKEKADAVGIEFMCTPFSPELAKAVDPFVKIHKVASSDLCHVPLLRTLNKLGKPVILSCGASGKNDIHAALEYLSDVRVILLYCVSAYPAREVELYNIQLMEHEFGKLVGFSDHTIDIRVIPSEAVKRGAVVIEKHFKAFETNSPDNAFALDRDQFKAMCESIKGKKMPLCYTKEEKEMLLKHNRRLIVTKAIPQGHVFKEGENYGCYRSKKEDSNGFSGFQLDRVEGQVALMNLQPGDSIGPTQVTLKQI